MSLGGKIAFLVFATLMIYYVWKILLENIGDMDVDAGGQGSKRDLDINPDYYKPDRSVK